MISIDHHTYRSTCSVDSRINLLVFHYTVLNFSDSIEQLTGPRVSTHYLVPDLNDATYQALGFQSMRIFNLVDEKDRAWHAGMSAWQGHTHLNHSSLGIEIVNTANEAELVFPAFTKAQIQAVQTLALNILQRYPEITPTQVVGHADIAPYRKLDPGPQFPWYLLHQAGIGAWYDANTQKKYVNQYNHTPLSQEKALQQLHQYGYDIAPATHQPAAFQQLIRVFQMHFRPSCYDGKLDVETAAILSALVEKYRRQA